MHKPESSCRMLKWTVELGQFEGDYKPRTAIKGQALADFMLEFPTHQEVESGALIVIPSIEEVRMESQNSAPWWSLFVDGASKGDGTGAGIELISLEAHRIRCAIHLTFHATNNDAEYEALINGPKLALKMKINGGYQAKGPRTELYLKCAQRIIARFNEVRLELIPRGQNEGADELAKLGSCRETTLQGVVPLDIQRQPSVPEHEVSGLSDNLDPTWMTPILAYIKEGSLLDEKNEARRIRYKAARYVLYDGVLYRRGFSVPLLNLVAPFTSLMSPWPFAMWGIDLIEELPKAKGGVKYAVVSVDYFTKWAEAEPLATITTKKLKEFVHKTIVCRYGIPYKLISNNGKQFDIKEMREFCEQLGIQKSFSAAKLEEKKGTWSEELSQVLWSYNTTPRTITGETPFSLVYGCEAMVPVEVGVGSFQRDNYDSERDNYDSEANEVNHRLYLDMIQETREDAQIRIAAYQQRTARHYNSKVRARTFKVGDLVLRWVMPNTKVMRHEVFGENWEGPYQIKSVLREGTYHLNDMQDKLIPRSRNAEHLRKYYQ
ncbi:uncharacterized protein LOC141674424 [Apium graveolens]|uniref:uncharacterized protein LOC141674424 n=1 Tax=Apium graveolens TaxID=4045 RepID=UPI003D7BFA23